MCLIRPDKFRYTVDPGLAWGFALMIFCEVLRPLLSDEHTVKPQTETFKTCFPVFYFSVSKTSICSWSSSRCRRTVSNSFFMVHFFKMCYTSSKWDLVVILYALKFWYRKRLSCRFQALYTYTPRNEDELELKEGDIVDVMEKCDDGWFVGKTGYSLY